MNVVWQYSKENDLVGDCFAGSGMTKFVCDKLKRKCVLSDINPTQDFVIKNDIKDGLPKEFKDLDLIFLDPPYWNMVKYGLNSLDKLSLKGFLESMVVLAHNCKKSLKPKGKVAFVIMPVKHNGEYIDLGFECFNIFKKHFKPIQRLCVPLVKMPHPTKEGTFIALLRDLIIMEKGGD